MIICDYLPSYLAASCGAVTSVLLWLLGGIDISIIWLFVFTVIDYITGTIYALKSHQWSSNVGSKGIIKKIFIYIIIIIANGMDQSAGISYIRQAVIIAYIINEAGSIIENIEMLGYGKIIPPVLRNGIKIISAKNNSITDKISDTSHE